MSEMKPLEPGQLALVQDQPVRVIDPLREDWWLVATIPEEEGVSPVEGWVPADKLQPTQGTCTRMYVCMYVCVCVCVCVWSDQAKVAKHAIEVDLFGMF